MSNHNNNMFKHAMNVLNDDSKVLNHSTNMQKLDIDMFENVNVLKKKTKVKKFYMAKHVNIILKQASNS